MEILIKKLNENAKLPSYEREASSGIDLYSLQEVDVAPGEKKRIQTGIAMAMPVGYIGLISCQHGMGSDKPIKVTPARLDSSYREEVTVEIENKGNDNWRFFAGDKIAELLVQKVHHALIIEAEDLSPAAE